MNKRLIIIGAGGHGKVCADIGQKMEKWNEICFLDDGKVGESLGFSIIDTLENFNRYKCDSDFFVAIGDNNKREEVQSILIQEACSIATLIHPSAILGLGCGIGVGSVLMAGSILNADSIIGQGCIINTSSTLDHDNILGEYVHISPASICAGKVNVGKKSWVGAGSVIINNINIGENVVIGAGSTVVSDIGSNCTVVGSPARVIK